MRHVEYINAYGLILRSENIYMKEVIQFFARNEKAFIKCPGGSWDNLRRLERLLDKKCEELHTRVMEILPNYPEVIANIWGEKIESGGIYGCTDVDGNDLCLYRRMYGNEIWEDWLENECDGNGNNEWRLEMLAEELHYENTLDCVRYMSVPVWREHTESRTPTEWLSYEQGIIKEREDKARGVDEFCKVIRYLRGEIRDEFFLLGISDNLVEKAKDLLGKSESINITELNSLTPVYDPEFEYYLSQAREYEAQKEAEQSDDS